MYSIDQRSDSAQGKKCKLECKLYTQSNSNELVLLDFKTGSKTYPKYRLQLAAYAYAYEEMTGRFPERCAVLHIPHPEDLAPKITETDRFTASELFPLFEVFLALRTVFAWLPGHDQSRLLHPSERVLKPTQ